MNPKIFKDEEPLDPVIKRGGYSVGAKLMVFTTVGIFLVCNAAWHIYAIFFASLHETHALFYLVCTGVIGIVTAVGGFIIGWYLMNTYTKLKWHNEDLK
jgi:hypothetical protein